MSAKADTTQKKQHQNRQPPQQGEPPQQTERTSGQQAHKPNPHQDEGNGRTATNPENGQPRRADQEPRQTEPTQQTRKTRKATQEQQEHRAEKTPRRRHPPGANQAGTATARHQNANENQKEQTTTTRKTPPNKNLRRLACTPTGYIVS